MFLTPKSKTKSIFWPETEKSDFFSSKKSNYFGTILGSIWDNFGVMLGTFGTILGSFWALLGPFWGHVGSIFGTLGTISGPFREYFATILGSFWHLRDHFGTILVYRRCGSNDYTGEGLGGGGRFVVLGMHTLYIYYLS